MDHRFSTLFFSAPPPLSHTDLTMSGALPDPKVAGKQRSKSTAMKHVLRKLFDIPRQKREPLIKDKTLAPAGESELSQQIWMESSSASETGKEESMSRNTRVSRISRVFARSSNSNSTVVVLPPSTQVGHGLKGKGILRNWTSITNKKRSSTNSTRDSKFSSISSIPSLASLHLSNHSPRSFSPGPSISLSLSELAALQSLIRRIERQLKKQEYLTNHLAGNLVHLLGRKEVQILCMKRCRAQEREMASKEVFRVKENIGRGFLRRGVLVGRSEGALNLLRTALDTATRAPSTSRNNRHSSSSVQSSSSRTSSPSSFKTAKSTTTASSLSRTPTSSSPIFSLPLLVLTDTTTTLSSCLSLHTLLNNDLKAQIYTSCLKSRWNGRPGGGMNGGNIKGNVNDGIMMKRFVSFVEGRVGLIDECGGKLEGLVGRIEGMGRRGVE